MDNEKLLDRTRKDLRSVLISAPRGVPMRLLLSDYKMVLGCELPYRQLGYHRVEDLLVSIPDVVRVGRDATGEQACFAVANASTSQIARFVALQKKPKLKRSNAPPLTRKSMYTGFTKKSKFGPSSARPKASPYSGRKFSGGGGNFYNSGGPRFNRRGPRSPHTPRQFSQPPRMQYRGPTSMQSPNSSSPGYNSSGPNRFTGNTTPTTTGLSRGSGNSAPRGMSSSNFSIASGSAVSAPGQRVGGARTNGASGSGGQGPGGTFPHADKVGSGFKIRSPPRQGQGQGQGQGQVYLSLKAPKDPKNLGCSAKSISDLGEWSKKAQGGETASMTSVEGYIAREKGYDTPTRTIKYLLYSGFEGKKGLLPAVMLFFKMEAWDVEDTCLDFHNIPVGSRLKVYGQPVSQRSKSKNVCEPAIKVIAYQYEPHKPSSGGGHSPSPSSSSSSPSSAVAPPPNIDRLIYNLIKGSGNGVWGKRLGNEYKKMYNMDAPSDIMDIALRLPFVTINPDSPEDNPLIDVPDEDPLPPARAPPISPIRAPSPDPPKQVVSFTTQKPVLPETVEFSSSEYSDVYVTFINNPISFYLQRVGVEYSDKLQAMTEAMGTHFTKSKIKPVLGVHENELYGYLWDEVVGEDKLWCRVLTSKVSKKMAEVYFPDYGNSEQVPLQCLVDLPRQFYQLPFQAVHCCLHGCAGVRDEATEIFIKHALEKTCVAQIMDSSGTRVAVELIDSESESGDTTINSIIMYALHPVSTLTPKLPNPGDPRVPVILTDIDEDGIVTVQLRGRGVDRLQQLMTMINDKYKRAQAADFVKTVAEGKIYCTQFADDKKYYRVVVKKGIPNKLLVEYIDYGNEEETEIRKLRKPLSDPLFKLPSQAVKCRLHDIPPLALQNEAWSESVSYFVASYLDCEDLYLTTMEGATEDCLPTVRLIISREEEEGEDESLNDLIMQQDFDNAVETEDVVVLDPVGGGATVSGGLPRPNSKVDTPSSVAPLGFGEGETMSFADRGNLTVLETLHSPSTPNSITPSSPVSQPITPSTSDHIPMTPPSLPSVTISTALPIFGRETTGVENIDNILPHFSLETSQGAESSKYSPGGKNSPFSGPRTPLTSPPFSSPVNLGGASRAADLVHTVTAATADLVLNGHNEASRIDAGAKVWSFAALSSEKPQAVSVVWVESPQNFVIQLVCNEEALSAISVNLKNMESLLKSPVRVDVKEGFIGCAWSSEHEDWYRVVVISATKDHVTVRFLDYGGTEVVNISKLKQLPAEFLALPFQGIVCTLRALQPLDNQQWSKEALSWFEDFVYDKIFFAIELTRDEPGCSCITLLDTSAGDQGTVDVRDSIRDAGFANFKV